jgi:hypothetical protein
MPLFEAEASLMRSQKVDVGGKAAIDLCQGANGK